MALLGELFGGGNQQQQTTGGGLPMQMAVLGALAYRTIKNRGGLSNLFGSGGNTNAQQNAAAPQADSGGGLFGGLTGMLGGMGGLSGLTGLLSQVSGGDAGGTISDGVQHLLDRFRKNGLGEKVESWISSGQNKPVSPGEMEQGMGSDMVNWLTKETGLPKDQLLSGLAKYLPEAVDKLTPNGKVPTPQEAQQHVNQQQMH
jgi:uncharacterized protein YidB (DUF937 family)